MGIDPFALQSPHMAKLLDPAERKKLGVSTPSESQQRWQAREERKIHSDLTAWLQCKGIPFVHSRMDKPSTMRRGWPDFTCMFGASMVVPGIGVGASSLRRSACPTRLIARASLSLPACCAPVIRPRWSVPGLVIAKRSM